MRIPHHKSRYPIEYLPLTRLHPLGLIKQVDYPLHFVSFTIFFIFERTEPPNNPHNCSLVNKTAHSLTLECLPGYSGGLQQTFYLQVYSINPNRLLKNLSNPEAPYFAISDLPAGYIFKLVIYSSNRKGNSKSIEITGSTTEPSPWKSGNGIDSNKKNGSMM